jgi:hypothetical protein
VNSHEDQKLDPFKRNKKPLVFGLAKMKQVDEQEDDE